jgi:aromatic ring hydroxylase
VFPYYIAVEDGNEEKHMKTKEQIEALSRTYKELSKEQHEKYMKENDSDRAETLYRLYCLFDSKAEVLKEILED